MINNTYFSNKVNELLKEFKEVFKRDVLSILILTREGTKITSLEQVEDSKLNEMQILLRRITKKYPRGTFKAGSHENQDEGYLIFEIGIEGFCFINVSRFINMDVAFSYGCILTEKLYILMEGRPISPYFPKVYSTSAPRNYIKHVDKTTKFTINGNLFAYKVLVNSEEESDAFLVLKSIFQSGTRSAIKYKIGTSIYKGEFFFKHFDIIIRAITWDLSQNRPLISKEKRHSFMLNSNIGILIFDASKRSTFDSVRHFSEEFTTYSPNITLVIICKNFAPRREISSLEGEKFANGLINAYYLELSDNDMRLLEDTLKICLITLLLDDFFRQTDLEDNPLS